jgi:hypothetical protein
MALYRVISTDLRTGTRIAELPLAGLRYSSVLNGAGELSGTLPLPVNDPDLAQIYNDAVDEVRRQIVVERDGTPVWCGIVWASPYEDEGQTRDVRAAETWSYYRKRTISTRRVYRATDQLTIARQLVTDANGVTGGDIGVTVGSETCGVTRDFNAEVYERKNVAEEIERMSELSNGFDFSIDPSWDADGNLVKNLRFWYPRRGRNFAATGHVFEVGRNNVIGFDWPTDGTRYANRVIVTGGGDGPSTRSAVRTNTDALIAVASGGAGYPLIEEVISESQEAVQANLNARAQNALNTYSQPVVVPKLVVRGEVSPNFGSYVVGDAVRFRCQLGLSPRFPNGIDTYRRIVGWTVNVDDTGSEEIDLLLGVEDGS